MLYIKFCLFALCTFCASISFGQYKVTGTVRDSDSDEPVAFVNITVLNSTQGVAGNENGFFELDLDKGRHTLVFSSIGYDAFTKEIECAKDNKTELNIYLNQTSQILNTVVVSASKYKQRIEDATSTIEVIKPKLIDNKNVTSLDKAIEQVPGITVIDNEPQMRGGSGFSSGLGSRVSVLIDGIPILRGDAGRPVWGFLPIDNVEQIEILKGASSVVYGSSALNGAINIRTAFPKSEPQTKYKLYTGIYSRPEREYATHWTGFNPILYGTSLNHAHKIKNFDVVVGFEYFHDPGYIGPVSEEAARYLEVDMPSRNEGEYEDRKRFNFAARYRFKKMEGLSVGLNGNFMKSQNAQTFFWMDADTNLYRSFPGSLSNFDETMFYLDPYIKYVGRGNASHSFKNRWFHSNNEADNNQSTMSDMMYNEYQYYNKIDALGGLVVTAGIMNLYVSSTGMVFSGAFDSTGTNTSENAALYVQLEKKFWEKLIFQLGGRWEYYKINDFEEDKPVFRSGLSYKITPGTFCRASFGQGYRYPSIGERYITTKVGRFGFYPNPDLKSESSWNAEAGIKQLFKVKGFAGFLDIAGFWQEYQNFVEFNAGLWGETIMDGFGFKFLNTGRARVTGIDISLAGQGKITENLELGIIAGYTFSKPVSLEPDSVYYTNQVSQWYSFDYSYKSTSSDTTQNILKYRIQNLAKLDIELKRKRFGVGVSARYYSFMRNIDNIFYDLDSPDYGFNTGVSMYREIYDHGNTIVDARVSYDLSRFKFSLLFNNLMNSEFSLRPITIEPPRTIMFQFVYKT